MTKLAISLSADKLTNLYDPFASVSIVSTDEGVSPVVVGKTEVINNTTSPDWTTRLFINDYDAEGDDINLLVTIYHAKSSDSKETILSAPFVVSDVINATDSIGTKELKQGHVTIRIEEAWEEPLGTLKFQLRGLNLVNTDGLGIFKKSDPFFEFHRLRHQTKRNIVVGDAVYRSTVLKNNLSPIWPAGSIDVEALVSTWNAETEEATDYLNQPFLIIVYDSDDKRTRQYIGQVQVTVNELLQNVNETALSDISKIDQEKSFTLQDVDTKKDAGKLLVLSAEIV